MEIHIDSVISASYDEFGDTLKLALGGGVSVRITGDAVHSLREALPGGDTDLSDLESAIRSLRSELEDAQSAITSRLDDAESNLADAESAIEDAKSAVDCHSTAGEALDEVERQLESLQQ